MSLDFIPKWLQFIPHRDICHRKTDVYPQLLHGFQNIFTFAQELRNK